MIDNFSINHSLKNLADINVDLILPYLHFGYLTVYLDMISNIFIESSCSKLTEKKKKRKAKSYKERN